MTIFFNNKYFDKLLVIFGGFMRSLIIKLLKWIDSLFGNDSKKVENEEPNDGEPQVESDDNPESVELIQESNEEPEHSSEEPLKTRIKGAGVTHCLWKPESDTHPKVAVIAVAADTIIRHDLRLHIKDKNGKSVASNVKTYSDHRGNQLPDHKFGRFNFKFGKKAETLSKVSPLTISFTIEVDGKSYPCKVGGLDEFVVTDPKKRWVCSGKRVRFDPK